MTKSNRKRAARRGRRVRVPRELGAIPMIRPEVHFVRTVRYSTTGALSEVGVTRSNLLNNLFFNTAGTTVNYRMCESVRIRSIEMWSIATTGGVSTASVEWNSENGPTRLMSDTSLGTARPLHIKTSPPADSLAGFWCSTGVNESQTMFTLNTAGVADVIEVTFEAVLQNFLAFGAPTSVNTTASGTVGTLYTGYLDGAVSGKCIPISVKSLL